jgi:hypothetical protein
LSFTTLNCQQARKRIGTDHEFTRNTVVDRVAKNALDDPVSDCSIPYTDIKPFIVKYILKRWQDSWLGAANS